MRLTFFILIFYLLTVIYVAQSEKLVKKRRIKKIIPRIREEASAIKGEIISFQKLYYFRDRP